MTQTAAAVVRRHIAVDVPIDKAFAGWEAVSDGVGHDGGWPLYLDRYAALSAG